MVWTVICLTLLPSAGFLAQFIFITTTAASADASSAVSKTFHQDRTLQGKVSANDVVFTTSVASLLECSTWCSSTCPCESFTFWRTDPPGRPQCQGHAFREMVSSQSQDVAGAKTFVRTDGDLTLTNVAAYKTATQGTTYGYSWAAGKAVDNDFNTDGFMGGSCSTTYESGTGNWWMVDLADVFTISSVRVTRRNDCCVERLRNFYIKIYNEDPTVNSAAPFELLNYHQGQFDGSIVTKDLHPCNGPITGRFVRIENGPNAQLALCEVEVMATSA